MSRIKDLIKELCPNGVEYIKLDELLNYIQPAKYIVKSTDYNDSYKIPVLTAGQTFILGFTNEETGIFNASKDKPVIIFDDFMATNHWVDFDFKVKSSAMKILVPKTNNILKYIYYCINNINYTPKEHSRQWIQNYSQFRIPLPPIEIQKEIVKILDKFGKLEAELEAELETRKIQYEFWRGKLINNDNNIVELGDVCKIIGRIGFRGYTRNDLVDSKEDGAISLSPGNIKNNNLNYDDPTYVSWEKYEESPEIMIDNNDIIFCKTGSTVGKVALVQNLPHKATINPQLVVLKELKCNPSYLAYLMGSDYFQSEVMRIKGLGSIPTISQKDLAKLKISLPLRNEQDKIAVILDKFNTLINDISVGIPAEIELRRQQYEYYRNKLLSFEEVHDV